MKNASLALFGLLISLSSSSLFAAGMCSEIFEKRNPLHVLPKETNVQRNILAITEILRRYQDQIYNSSVRIDIIALEALIVRSTNDYNRGQDLRIRKGQVANYAPAISASFEKAFKAFANKPKNLNKAQELEALRALLRLEPYFQWLQRWSPEGDFAGELYALTHGRFPVSHKLALFRVRSKHDPAIYGDALEIINKTILPTLELLDRIEKLVVKLESENTYNDIAWNYAFSSDALITKRQQILNYIYTVSANRFPRKTYEAFIRLFAPSADPQKKSDGDILKYYALARSSTERWNDRFNDKQFAVIEKRAQEILARSDLRDKLTLDDDFYSFWILFTKEQLSYERTLLALYFEKPEAVELRLTLESITSLIELRQALKDLHHLKDYLSPSGDF